MFQNTHILIPVYNEESKVEEVVNSLKSHFSNVVAVNDASTDKTKEILDKLDIKSIHHSINLGVGGAIKTGIEFIIHHTNAEFVITFDADGQHSVNDAIGIAKLLESNKFDVILASRFLDKEFIKEIPFLKRILLILAIKLLAYLSKLDLTDVHNGLKGYKVNSLKKIRFKSDKYSFENEIFFEIKKNKFKFIEFPSKVVYTEYSKSKGQSMLNSTLILEDLIYILFRK